MFPIRGDSGGNNFGISFSGSEALRGEGEDGGDTKMLVGESLGVDSLGTRGVMRKYNVAPRNATIHVKYSNSSSTSSFGFSLSTSIPSLYSILLFLIIYQLSFFSFLDLHTCAKENGLSLRSNNLETIIQFWYFFLLYSTSI